MSSEVRQAIEAAIDRHDGGNGAPVGMVIESATRECGFGPTLSKARTLYVNGEIYTVGDDRLKLTAEEGSALIADGGAEDGGEPPMADEPGISALAPDPDPETAHADYLLGRRIRVDWGERTDVGEIVAVQDFRDHDRELKIRIETETAFRDRVFRPARTACELVEEDGGDSP